MAARVGRGLTQSGNNPGLLAMSVLARLAAAELVRWDRPGVTANENGAPSARSEGSVRSSEWRLLRQCARRARPSWKRVRRPGIDQSEKRPAQSPVFSVTSRATQG